MNKLQIGVGFHTSSTCFCDGIGTYLTDLAAAGHVITAQSTDSTSSLMDFQREIQNGATGHGFYRCLEDYDVPNYGAPVKEEAQKYLNKLDDLWPPELDKSLFYVELINEPDKNQSDWLGWFMVELGRLLMIHGYNFCGPGWSLGEPEPEHNRTPGMLAWFRLCSENRGRLAHAVHEYALENNMKDTIPWWMGRLTDVNKACDENGIAWPDIAITEFGWNYQTAPNWQNGVPQIIEMLDWYIDYAPNVISVPGLWALDRSPQWADIDKIINPYMEPLAAAISSRSWEQPEIPDPKPPVEKPKIVILKLAQTNSEAAWTVASAYAFNNYKRTVTASHDDMMTMLGNGSSESYAIIVDPDRPSQKDAIVLLKEAGYRYEVIYIEDKPSTPRTDILAYRPCATELVTQIFGARPEYYNQFGLPGHEGIDYGVPLGEPYFAAQAGTVVWASNKTGSGRESNYGWHVYLKHKVDDLQFHTVYAHAQPDLPVEVGQVVKAGDIVARSGNSGVSTGPHLHFGVLWQTDTGNGYPMWRYGQNVDPAPYLAGKDAPVSKQQIHMLPYIAGDGRLYEVGDSNGGHQRFQTQRVGNEIHQTKDHQAEQFLVINGKICRGWDLSPGGNRWYQQQEQKGDSFAPWIPEYWAEGESFTISLWVQFYDWNCHPILEKPTGWVVDTRKFIKHHDTWTSRGGITLENVSEIQWINGGETYFYGLNYGLVAWERTHQDPFTPSWSAIDEIHEPGQRPDNVVRYPDCF